MGSKHRGTPGCPSPVLLVVAATGMVQSPPRHENRGNAVRSTPGQIAGDRQTGSSPAADMTPPGKRLSACRSSSTTRHQRGAFGQPGTPLRNHGLDLRARALKLTAPNRPRELCQPARLDDLSAAPWATEPDVVDTAKPNCRSVL